MRRVFGWLAVGSLLLGGCEQQPAANTTPSGAPPATAAGAPAGSNTPVAAGTTAEPGDPAAASQPPAPSAASDSAAVAGVPIEGGAATLTPANTKITFVGTHAAPKAPDPRTGTFEKFAGKAEIDADGKMLKSVSVEIETGSLKTPIPMLTNHLSSPDFFDTEKYPTARFESTSIAAGEGGQATITGNLTLLETTKEISFPATITVSDAGLTLKAEFKINRLDFGVGVNQKGVEEPVSLTVTVGEPAKG